MGIYQKPAKLCSFAVAGDADAANNISMMLSTPQPVVARLILAYKLNEGVSHIVFKGCGIAVFFLVDIAVQVGDISDISRTDFRADGNVLWIDISAFS